MVMMVISLIIRSMLFLRSLLQKSLSSNFSHVKSYFINFFDFLHEIYLNLFLEISSSTVIYSFTWNNNNTVSVV